MAGRPALFLLPLLAAIRILHAVTPVPAGALIRHPAHYFNLAHKRLLFIPGGPAAYKLTVAPEPRPVDRGIPLGKPSDPKGYSWRAHLPFAFGFAGRSWEDIYINLNGTLTFGVAEATSYPERETWADGTIRSMATALDVRAITGERPVIAPLWGRNSADSTRIFTRSAHDTFSVIWQAVRYQGVNEGYTPLGVRPVRSFGRLRSMPPCLPDLISPGAFL